METQLFIYNFLDNSIFIWIGIRCWTFDAKPQDTKDLQGTDHYILNTIGGLSHPFLSISSVIVTCCFCIAFITLSPPWNLWSCYLFIFCCRLQTFFYSHPTFNVISMRAIRFDLRLHNFGCIFADLTLVYLFCIMSERLIF